MHTRYTIECFELASQRGVLNAVVNVDIQNKTLSHMVAVHSNSIASYIKFENPMKNKYKPRKR